MDADNVDLALLVLRVVFGLALVAHGAQKLFGAMGGPGLAGFAGWLGSMGIRQPRVAAFAAASGEFFGGLAFALGLLTPLAAFLIMAVMFVAIATVHWKAGFFNANGGYEFNVAIIAVAFAVTVSGPGSISLDDALDIARDVSGWEWGLGSLLVAAVIAAGSLLGRTREAPAQGGPADPTAG